ncbi:protein of unknown function DUF501 [Thermotoga petrophila RKU-1]|uniref:DUF501 domain-containing protein n=1 Tax=Thermotoga petrophila (strain ATCC BAA-488 / DSM 13995 / JCM 10881 / RKU-1) TaxID=390874 RepID=A5IN98_THEP1|nr:DUF501 domain-containing protein [Thermotoga petrophila]ABQ47671.1 protein of unknown function DUF501 [Thermotoga petrophila RKU-1]
MGNSRDEKIVEWQIGRKITNMNRVAYRCPYGYPVVIESLPIKNGKPFPTLYWLTCPHLRREVSKLESEGFIKKLEDRIASDVAFREKMRKAHLEVIERRKRLLTEEHSFREVLEKVGTGGIRDFSKVKCLHLHLADYLAGVGNPVGETVWNLIEKKFCDDVFCKIGEARE